MPETEETTQAENQEENTESNTPETDKKEEPQPEESKNQESKPDKNQQPEKKESSTKESQKGKIEKPKTDTTEEKSGETMQVVILTLIDEYFGLSIEYITEIIKATEITRIPNSPDYIEGAINLRGKIIIIVDLAKKLGVSRKDSSKDTRIVVVEIDEEWIGLRVDSVTETIILDKNKVHEPPSLIKEKIGDEHIVGVTRFNKDTLLTIIDPYKILEK
ncbi:MAG: chemotaxis protein CheW [Candidatus Woesearchaeota archaeon]